MDQSHLIETRGPFESPNTQFIEQTATAFWHCSEIV